MKYSFDHTKVNGNIVMVFTLCRKRIDVLYIGDGDRDGDRTGQDGGKGEVVYKGTVKITSVGASDHKDYLTHIY